MLHNGFFPCLASVGNQICLSRGLLLLSPQEGQKKKKHCAKHLKHVSSPLNTLLTLELHFWYTAYIKVGSPQNLSSCILPQILSDTSKNV